MRPQHLCNERSIPPRRQDRRIMPSYRLRNVMFGRTDVVWLQGRKSKRKVMLRDCAYDKHPICEGPIVFARIDFRNLSIDGDHIRTTTNIQQDPSEDIDARMFEEIAADRGLVIVPVKEFINRNDLRLRLRGQFRLQVNTLPGIHGLAPNHHPSRAICATSQICRWESRIRLGWLALQPTFCMFCNLSRFSPALIARPW